MVEIIWTEPALSDFAGIVEYIACDKPDAAARLVQRVFAHVEKLADHPELGPAVPELRSRSRYRQIVEPPCRVLYRYDRGRQKLFILGVMRGEKLFERRLLLDWDKFTTR